MDRRLTAEEAALWRRVMANVRPRAGHALPAAPVHAGPTGDLATKRVARVRADKMPAPAPFPAPPLKPARRTGPGTTLDGGWDKRLATGAVTPDSSIDLHGYRLEAAHTVLDAALDRAIRRGDRVLLLITGKPPRPESERPHARGRIREAVGDWLAASRHAPHIAAVRAAHPRHGGAGALYLILRRMRGHPAPIY